MNTDIGNNMDNATKQNFEVLPHIWDTIAQMCPTQALLLLNCFMTWKNLMWLEILVIDIIQITSFNI